MNPSAYRRPAKTEYNEYYDNYVQRVPAGDLLQVASSQVDELRDFFGTVAEPQAIVLHTPYTWTIKQVVGHLIDTERIFADRFHRFSCGDLQPIPGMNQDDYVANSDYKSPMLASLVSEWLHCRQANVYLMRRTKPAAWDNIGVASGYDVTVRALGYMLVGHVEYHMKIVRKRLST